MKSDATGWYAAIEQRSAAIRRHMEGRKPVLDIEEEEERDFLENPPGPPATKS